MEVTIPIYVQGTKKDGGATVYTAHPLFFPAPRARHERLDRLLNHLTRELGKHFAELGKQSRHESLAACTFNPKVHKERRDLTLPLRRRTARCRFFLVSFSQFGRRIGFTPSIPDLWFDVARGEKLGDRATEVLTRHFRDQERDDGAAPEKFALTGSAFITHLDLNIEPQAMPAKDEGIKFLMLGDQGPMNGSAELHRVGRCLDWLYPDDLDRVELRETELAELSRLLEQPDRRPILLIGPRQVGKSAVIHDQVYRTVHQREGQPGNRRNTWLLAPARLISGMSFVGQWENRLLAILKHARKRDHILYFDDLPGLFQAGHTCNSTLSVAAVLKPYLERGEIRVLAEITPEAYRVLRERDRGFADLFHLLPIRQTSDQETLRILVNVQRGLEGQHRCRFALDIIPTVIDLQRRYGGDTVFPGKAASLLRQLAIKYKGAEVRREAVLEEFRSRSGLARSFLDRQARLDRQDVLDQLGSRLIGQEAALRAAADVIAIAKARLNDPERPLASFLFLGPTGVGKTECAKAIAEYLFGDAERLLRFDLNEYAAADSSARLVGTFGQPEGLLTSAVRRQPFTVVLFDEIEKARPEVFDLLLQVLGEGRLSDALGRTADFTNALIVMTSNLGVRESESHLGFHGDDTYRDQQFVRAAERFFRPEFFNRLDRIIPFHRLERAQVRRIAAHLLKDVFHREGLQQRKCFLSVEESALEHIVDLGFDPVLGARALKRAIERQLTQPIAERLAALRMESFTVVRVYAGQREIKVRTEALEEVKPRARPAIDFDQPEQLLERIKAALHRIEMEFASLRPAGPIAVGQACAKDYQYFALRERARGIDRQIRRLEDRFETARRAQRRPSYRRPDAARRHPYKVIRSHGSSWVRPLLREIAAALDINEFLHELAAQASEAAAGPYAEELWDLVGRTALLQAMGEGARKPDVAGVILWPWSLTAGHGGRTGDFLTHYKALSGRDQGVTIRYPSRARDLLTHYKAALTALDLEATYGPPTSPRLEEQFYLWVEGPHAWSVLKHEAGMHIYFPRNLPNEPIQMIILPVGVGPDPEAVASEWMKRREEWLQELAKGNACVEADPLPCGPVVRVYSDAKQIIDLGTGLVLPEKDLVSCLYAALPVPHEIPATEG